MKTLGIALAVAASLLSFPGVLSWMTAFWIIWFTADVLRGKSGLLPTLACCGVIIVKGAPISMALVAFLGALIAAAVAILIAAGTTENRRSRLRWVTIAAVWLTWGLLLVDCRQATTANAVGPFEPHRPIICLGDSISSGMPPQEGFPLDLQRLVRPDVISFARPGITTEDAISRLPDLQALRPQAVVIELGGHDFLKGKSRAETYRQLESIVLAAKQSGAAVILMEIPRGFIRDPYRGLERELARKHDLQLISDGCIRQLVLWSPHAPPGMWTRGPYLSEDGLHPNAAGNELLARTVASALHRLYGPDILK